MGDPSALPFSWLVVLFLVGFLTPLLESVGKKVVRRLRLSLGTTEPGYAIIGGTSIGLAFGIAKGLFDAAASLSRPAIDFAALLREPIEYTFKGIVAGGVISIAHTFLDAYLIVHPLTDYVKRPDSGLPDSTDNGQSHKESKE
jgi:hypothetical protein